LASARKALEKKSAARLQARLDSYGRLADIFHAVLSEQSLDLLLERIADALAELVPYDTLTIYSGDEEVRVLLPLLARDLYAEEILNDQVPFGEGITGWAVENRTPVLANNAHLDDRAVEIPGTPYEPGSLISVPLIARRSISGALNVYRNGEGAYFNEDEFELAKRFADAAALALDNAQTKVRLERQAQTDSLTGLHNHRFFYDRLRAELNRASRAHDTIALLMFDIDDFKRLNDVYGHGVGDQVLIGLASAVRGMVRGSDVVCRIGGEEFTVIMPSSDAGDALGFAGRLIDELNTIEFETAGRVTVSLGIAQAPEHAMSPRELVSCAEAAMMTAKVHGKNRVVVYEEDKTTRPMTSVSTPHDVRSIAHLKMLQSLAGKLNRLNDVSQIATTISNELRTLIDYHSCRVYLVHGDQLLPVSLRGDHEVYGRENALHVKLGEGITGKVAVTGRPLLIRNALECDFAVQVPGTEEIEESIIGVPLSYGTKVIGVLVISKLGADEFDEDDVRLLEVLAGNASVALENARLYTGQKEEAEIANALLMFSRALTSAEGMEDVLTKTVELSALILGVSKVGVWLQEIETGDVVAEAHWGYEGEERDLISTLRVPGDIALKFLRQGEPFQLGAHEIDEIRFAMKLSQTSVEEQLYAVAPVRLEGGRLGWVTAISPANGAKEFSAKQMRLLTGIAHQARLALANANSFQTLEQTFLSTVEALANALEAKDEYTSAHTRWITDMTLEVGARMGLSGKDLKDLELGALFHDIGKIGIPHSILLKPGPLSAGEWQVMRTHPELGERILRPIERLADVRPIVRACHEHYDGGGYPDGKRGEEIPLGSRIILVCDAFHAMTTDRPYRTRLPEDEAYRRLQEGAGTQFDPNVVEVFVQMMQTRPDLASTDPRVRMPS
jgi:diguanylate cyclase (GGDEF)-like protein